MASASPSTNVTVVDALGTRSSASHSRSTPASSETSAHLANVDDPLQPEMPITTTPRSCTISTKRQTSAVSPEFEMAISTSPCCTKPLSPCNASAACTNEAGVPVDDNV